VRPPKSGTGRQAALVQQAARGRSTGGTAEREGAAEKQAAGAAKAGSDMPGDMNSRRRIHLHVLK